MSNNNWNLQRVVAILIIPMLVALVAISAEVARNKNLGLYNAGIELYREKNFTDSRMTFEQIKTFKLSSTYLELIDNREIIEKAAGFLLSGDYYSAYNEIILIDDNKMNESSIKVGDAGVKDDYSYVTYSIAVALFEEKKYEESKELFYKIKQYKDSVFYADQLDVKTLEEKRSQLYDTAIEKYNCGEYKEAYEAFALLDDYKESKEWKGKSEIEVFKRNLNMTVAAGINISASIGENGQVLYTNHSIPGMEDCNNWINIISIDSYGDMIIGLSLEKKAYLAGKYNNGKEKIDTSLWTGVIDIALGEQFALALKEDGTVVADGHNGDGQCDVKEWNNIVDVDAGWRFAVGLTQDGQLRFSGYADKQRADYQRNKEKWKEVIRISASGGETDARKESGKKRGNGHIVGLKKDGTVVAIGDNTYGQCDVDDWKDIVRIITGDWYTVGIRSDGRVLITGDNKNNTYYIEHKLIESIDNVIDAAAGYGQTICLLSDGSIKAFGFDDFGKNSKANEWAGLETKDNVIKNSILVKR